MYLRSLKESHLSNQVGFLLLKLLNSRGFPDRQDAPRTFYICLILPMSKLFEQLGGQDDGSRNIPLACYEFLSAKTPEEQQPPLNLVCSKDSSACTGGACIGTGSSVVLAPPMTVLLGHLQE